MEKQRIAATAKSGPQLEPIMLRGRCIGLWDKESQRLLKTVDSRKHRVLHPLGYAVATVALEYVEARGALTVRLTELNTGRILQASIDDFRTHGVAICLGGYEPQVCLPLNHWVTETAKEPRQLALSLEGVN